jgi:hypothetical protein
LGQNGVLYLRRGDQLFQQFAESVFLFHCYVPLPEKPALSYSEDDKQTRPLLFSKNKQLVFP